VELAAGTVANAGTITGGAESGVYLLNGSVTNAAGGRISGTWGTATKGTGTVVNAGTLSGAVQSGVYLGGGSVTNQAGGVIAGNTGVDIRGAAGTVVTSGSIAGYGGTAVQLAAGFANRLVVNPGAAFTGGLDGGNTIGATIASTLELASAASAGTFSGLGTAVVDFAAIAVDAGAAWTLAASNSIAAGVTLSNAGTVVVAGTLRNAGKLVGGVAIAGGGALIDAATGTITAASGDAVYGFGGPVTVTVAGVVDGAGLGIELVAGGAVTNQAGGRITGGFGLAIEAEAGTVVNDGTITASAQSGVYWPAVRSPITPRDRSAAPGASPSRSPRGRW
jgi:hypothetical protein